MDKQAEKTKASVRKATEQTNLTAEQGAERLNLIAATQGDERTNLSAGRETEGTAPSIAKQKTDLTAAAQGTKKTTPLKTQNHFANNRTENTAPFTDIAKQEADSAAIHETEGANIPATHEAESANLPATQETERTRLLVGEAAVRALAQKRVAVFGIGGVGGYAAEALARAGVGAIDLVDDDKVALSDINRQIYALHSTVGMFKTDVAARRIADISPACKVTAHKTFFLPSNADEFDFSAYDYVVDAIDTVAGKLAIIGKAKRAGVPVVSAMGAGNKLDPCAFEVADIFSTSVCPLAKIMRKKLREMGVDSLKVVYSKEEPRCDGSCGIAAACDEADSDAERVEASGACAEPVGAGDNAACAEPAAEYGRPQGKGKKRSPGSISFVPPVVGFILAGEVIKDLIGINRK